MKKGIASVFFTVCLMLSFVSCGSEHTKTETDDTGRFRGTEILLPDGFEIGNDPVSLSGDMLRVSGWFVVDGDYSDTVLTIDAAAGEVLSDDAEGIGSNDDGFRESGRFPVGDGYLTVRRLPSGDGIENVSLLLTDGKGNNTDEYDCAELFGVDMSAFSGNAAAGDGFFEIVFAAEDDGGLYIVSNTGAVHIGRNGDIRHADSPVRLDGAVMTGGGLKVFGGDCVYDVDFSSGEITKGDITGLRNAKMIPIPGYEFGGITGTTIYGWNPGSDGGYEESLVCDLFDADISGRIVSAAVGDRYIYAVVNDSFDYTNRLWRLDMIPQEEIKEQKTLTLAVIGLVDDLTTYAVCEFNRAHDDIRIVITYSSGTDRDYSSALTEFERDALSGRLADIVLISTDTGADIANYTEKGFFADMAPIMERCGYDSGNILDSVKEMSGLDGIYYLPLETTTSTIYGRSPEFPNGLTLGNMLEKLEGLDEDECLMQFMSFSSMLSLSLDEFIDYETGKTDFANDLFRRFAEDYRKFGNSCRTDVVTETDSYAALAKGEILLFIGAPDAGIYAKCAANYGIDDLVSVGYPSSDGGRTILKPKLVIAVSKDASDPDTAFDLIRTRISDKYIVKNNSLKATVTKSSLSLYLRSIPRWLYYGKYGLKSSAERLDAETAGRDVGEGYFEYHLTDKKLGELRDGIQNARPVTPLEKKIISVIMEELDVYKNREEMSLDETTRIINDRVGILYNEKN